MESQQPLCEQTLVHDHDDSGVDTSRPFRSVKEAVAVFGERFLTGDIYHQKLPTISKKEAMEKPPPPLFLTSDSYSQKLPTSPKQEAMKKPVRPLSSTPCSFSNPKQPGDGFEVVNTLEKLQIQLEETKLELKLLKERESKIEVALASLNAELHKSMSKMAKAEAKAEAAATVKSMVVRDPVVQGSHQDDVRINEEAQRWDSMERMEHSSSLAEILSLCEEEGYFGGQKKQKMMKQKPIIPLVGDIFSRKKSTSTSL